jgi:hypothetical protein
MTSSLLDHLPGYGQALHYLEALHFHDFTVTIHSPRTSHNGLYCVTAYGNYGTRVMTWRGSNASLDKAIRQVGRKLGEERLKAYAIHSFDIGLVIAADQQAAEKAGASA